MVKANADVKGLTYCVLQCLQLAGLHESLALYPEFAPRFSRGLRGELSYNLGAGGGPAEVRALGLCVGGLEAWGVGQRGGLRGVLCERMAWCEHHMHDGSTLSHPFTPSHWPLEPSPTLLSRLSRSPWPRRV